MPQKSKFDHVSTQETYRTLDLTARPLQPDTASHSGGCARCPACGQPGACATRRAAAESRRDRDQRRTK